MMSLPTAFGLAFRQLGDPAIVKVLAKSLLATLVVFVVLGAGLLIAIDRAFTAMEMSWGAELGVLAAVVLTLIAGWLLFRFVALFVLQFFVEDVVRAVEARHYPQALGDARSLALHEEVSNGLRSTLRALLANLVALPFAILLLATGIGTALLFWAVNAFLLGRELQDMVWLRHRLDRSELAPIGGKTRFALGGIVAGLMVLPFANLLAPVLGAAMATHMVHRGRVANA